MGWPGYRTTAWHQAAKPFRTNLWFGSLVDGMYDASGQMYMRNRYYDPATGQFTQADPIGLAGGLNAYGFASGDPVSYADPSGLCTAPAGRGIGICFETFIQGKMFGYGDDRGPSSNGGTFKTSIRFSIDPATGQISGLAQQLGLSRGRRGTGPLMTTPLLRRGTADGILPCRALP